MKDHLEDFIPILTDIINSSLESGKFPDILKNVAVRPLLKKANLPLEEENYRPVSNLSYLGKLIERAACNQIVDLASSTGNIENNQSEYRVGHSMESTLLKVKSDLLHAQDKQEVTLKIINNSLEHFILRQKRETCLGLLDLSAAFDTVDHDLLLDRLHFRCGFDKIILNWILSYLRLRTQQVLIGDNTFSDPTCLNVESHRVVSWDLSFSPFLWPLLERSAKNMELTFNHMQMINRPTSLLNQIIPFHSKHAKNPLKPA